MAVHHLALRSPHPAALAAFYERALGLTELRRAGDDGEPRSVWLDLGGTILMVEHGARRVADSGWDGMFLLASAGSGADWVRRWRELGVQADGQTAFTVYARDPEGNRFGVSSFPEALFGDG